VWTVESLQEFEKDIAACFERREIRAPIHLAGGNEQQLIDIFFDIKSEDWICVQWRSHVHCLLKGVPPERLRKDIIAGHSITLNYPEYHIISSAVAGGILPIGIGIAIAIRRSGGTNKVWCFVGDMTSYMGTYWECTRYAHGHDLPVRFVIEDNGKSVNTSTKEVWGHGKKPVANIYTEITSSPWPHMGTGKWVEFT